MPRTLDAEDSEKLLASLDERLPESEVRRLVDAAKKRLLEIFRASRECQHTEPLVRIEGSIAGAVCPQCGLPFVLVELEEAYLAARARRGR